MDEIEDMVAEEKAAHQKAMESNVSLIMAPWMNGGLCSQRTWALPISESYFLSKKKTRRVKCFSSSQLKDKCLLNFNWL